MTPYEMGMEKFGKGRDQSQSERERIGIENWREAGLGFSRIFHTMNQLL